MGISLMILLVELWNPLWFEVSELIECGCMAVMFALVSEFMV